MRHALLLALSASLVTAFGACSATPNGAGPSVTGTASSEIPVATARPTLTGRYVALGSSFAAGPSIPEPAADGGGCGRSTNNYAHVLAKRMELDLVDVSCIGATVANITSPQGPNPPQLDAITPDTALVTMTIGGNDIGYSSSTLECASKTQAGQSCSVPDEATIAAKSSQMGADLAAAVRTMKAKAPNATIVLVSYLRVFPEADASCPPSNPIGQSDTAALARMGAILENTFSDVATQTEITLVDPYADGAAHTICAPEHDRWVEGAVQASPAFAYHPNGAGMAAVADLVLAAL